MRLPADVILISSLITRICRLKELITLMINLLFALDLSLALSFLFHVLSSTISKFLFFSEIFN